MFPDEGLVFDVEYVHDNGLYEVEVLQLLSEHDEVQGRVRLQLTCLEIHRDLYFVLEIYLHTKKSTSIGLGASALARTRSGSRQSSSDLICQYNCTGYSKYIYTT